MKNKIATLIPVRSGSRRLPNKNILPFGISNFLIHKIRQLKQIDKIVVYPETFEQVQELSWLPLCL